MFLDDGLEQTTIDILKTTTINGQQLQRLAGCNLTNLAAVFYVNKVTYATQKLKRDTSRQSRTIGDFHGRVRIKIKF